MMDCWKAEPDERPSFEVLQEKLTKILRDQVRNLLQVHKSFVSVQNPENPVRGRINWLSFVL